MWSVQKGNTRTCTEVPGFIEDKFERKKCITLAHKFELLCLNKTILNNVLVVLHETRGDRLENDKEYNIQHTTFINIY